MLKGINPLLNADVLQALRAMGHGDDLIIADTNFPADSTARQTRLGKLLRIDATAAEVAAAVLSVYPLDTFVDDAAARMEIVGKPERNPAGAEGSAEGDRRGRGQILADDQHRALRLLRARQAGLLRHPDRRAPLLRLLRLPQGRRSAGREIAPWPPKPIVILGVFVADTAYRAARPPRMGETILGTGFALGPGGKGSNQAVAAARLGADVSFITRLGQDPFADMAMKAWAEAGVKPAVIVTPRELYGCRLYLHRGGNRQQRDHRRARRGSR